jgi:hypothetical protein
VQYDKYGHEMTKQYKKEKEESRRKFLKSVAYHHANSENYGGSDFVKEFNLDTNEIYYVIGHINYYRSCAWMNQITEQERTMSFQTA